MKIRTRDDLAELMRDRGVSYVFTPLVTKQRDGTWLAQYPGADWDVTAGDAETARERLRAAELERMRDPARSDWRVAAVQKYLTYGPTPGVYELDAQVAARIYASADESQLDAVLERIDRQRSTQC